jgi:hypothetical protein
MDIKHVVVKVDLPHARYADLAAQLPGLVEQVVQPAPGQPAGTSRQAVPAAASGLLGETPPPAPAPAAEGDVRPTLLFYTHVPGCLTAVMEYDVPCRQLLAADELMEQLQALLPPGMRPLHVSCQDISSSGISGGAVDGSRAPGGVWSDPVALPAGDAPCSIDVVLPAAALQLLPAGAVAQSVRVVVAAARGGAVLADCVLSLDGDGTAQDWRLQVGKPAPVFAAWSKQAPARKRACPALHMSVPAKHCRWRCPAMMSAHPPSLRSL